MAVLKQISPEVMPSAPMPYPKKTVPSASIRQALAEEGSVYVACVMAFGITGLEKPRLVNGSAMVFTRQIAEGIREAGGGVNC